MRIGRFNARIFMEGIEVPQFSRMTLSVSEGTSPLLQLTYPATKNIRVLLPSTVVQVFVRDEGEGEKWFLLFDGYLVSKQFFKSVEQEQVTLVFNAITSYFEKLRHAAYNVTDPMLGLSADIIMVNLGQQGDSPYTIPVRNPTTGEARQDYLSLERWSAYQNAGGLPAVITDMMWGISINTPYFKIVQDSFKIIERYKLYDSSKLFELAKDVQGFTGLQKDLVQSNSTQTYKQLLSRTAILGLSEFIELGIPSLSSDKKQIISSMMIQRNDYAIPPIFNVIYPDEYNSYQINFNFENEPTRVLNSSFTTELGSPLGFDSKANILPTFLSPVKELLLKPVKSDADGKVTYFLKFTEEEKYRGVNPRVVSSTPYEFAYASMSHSKKKEESAGVTFDNTGSLGSPSNTPYPLKTGDIPPPLEHLILTPEKLLEFAKEVKLDNEIGFVDRMLFITEMLYIKSRLESRGIGHISVPCFNPNWLIGFPGIVVTEMHGPILVNFSNYTVNINAEGSASTTLTISKPRFLNDTLAMDQDAPTWYESYLKKETIGKELYNTYSKYGTTRYKDKGCSIADVFKTTGSKTPIESAAIKLTKPEGYMTNESRKRSFVDNITYFNLLKVNTSGGFPTPAKTLYRSAKDLDAATIASAALKSTTPIEWLECPYVYERGQKVLEWLGKTDTKLLIGKKFAVPEAIALEEINKDEEEVFVSPLPIDSLEKVQASLRAPELLKYILFSNVSNLRNMRTTGAPGYVEVLKNVMLNGDRIGKCRRDLLSGKGRSNGAVQDVKLSPRIIELLLYLADNYKRGFWGIINLISSHNYWYDQAQGKVSPHGNGRAVDIVALDFSGMPNELETDELANFLKKHVLGKKFGCSQVIWDYRNRGKSFHHNADNTAAYSGMHIHITIREN